MENIQGDNSASFTPTILEQPEINFKPQCRALWDWNADVTDAQQISFKAGDIITIKEREPDGWWYGECLRTKEVGFFPGNYVEVIQRNWKVDSGRVNPKIAALQQNLKPVS